MKKYAILGFPLSHTFSPAMQNAAFKALNIPAEYSPIEVSPDAFEDFLKAADIQELEGFNITVPFKEKIIPFLDHVSNDEASYIGAVNTVRKHQGKFEGFNTDWSGFQESLLEDLGCDPVGKKAFVLGAGGSAKAILFALEELGVAEIFLFNRTKSKAEELAEAFKKAKLVFLEKIDSVLLEVDLVVNTTSCGLKPDDPLLIAEDKIPQKEGFFYDLIYNPEETKQMKAFKGAGWKVSGGLGMLLHQGAKAFEIWTGEKAPLEVMKEALLEQIKESA